MQTRVNINYVFSLAFALNALAFSLFLQAGIANPLQQREVVNSEFGTMNVESIKEIIERQPNLSTALGMEFISTPDDDLCMATMKVDERNRQPFGFLSGGASLALAENVAGVGSSALCPGKICVGISVSGSHVKAVAEGDTVTALAHLVQKGRTLHVWNVEITDSSGDIISVVHVTNYVVNPKVKEKSNKGVK